MRRCDENYGYSLRMKDTAECYLDFLILELVPAVTVMFPKDVNPDILKKTLWFQHDGAPPHNGMNLVLKQDGGLDDLVQ